MRLWLVVLALGVASGTAAFTISRTTITSSLRGFVASHSRWLGKLLSCSYCLSHWLAAVAVAIYRPRVIDGSWLIVDLGVSWLISVLVATITFGLIGQSIKTLG